MQRSTVRLLKEYFSFGYDKYERLGQYFINNYHGGQWQDLFYCEDTVRAARMIDGWLFRNQYREELPRRATKIQQAKETHKETNKGESESSS